MGNLFNPDNKFFVFMGRIADLMILNLLCIVCCLPIVTAGPSITALYYVTLKMVRNEETYIVRGFFHSFRQNLKQGIIINIIMLVVGILLVFDLYFCRVMQTQSSFYKVLNYLFMVGTAVYVMLFIYIYPVLSKFYNSIKRTFLNAFLMSIRHFPYTILMLVITAAPIVLAFVVSNAFAYVLLFYILLGFSVIAYINSNFFVKIFDKYIPEEAADASDESLKEIDASVFKNLQPTNESPEEIESAENTETGDSFRADGDTPNDSVNNRE